MEPRHGLRDFLFPSLRATYEDLLHAATQPARADLLLLGELNYAGPVVAEVTGIPWASYVLAPLSFFSAFDPPVLPPYPRLARADKAVPGMGRVIRRLARFTTRSWPEPIYELRRELGLPRGPNPLFDAKHSPHLALALFSRVLGVEQRDWPANTLITGFCYYDADGGNAKLSPEMEGFLAPGEPPVVFTLGSAAVLAAGKFYEHSARAAIKVGVRAVLLIGTDQRNRPPQALPDSICVAEYAPYSALFPRAHGGAPGRGGHYGTVSQGRQADADHALFARPAGQRPAHAPVEGGARDQARRLHAAAGGAKDTFDSGGAEVCATRAQRGEEAGA